MKIINKIKHYVLQLRIIIEDIIYFCDCPFDTDDNPFPQACDKRVINNEYCKTECPWRHNQE